MRRVSLSIVICLIFLMVVSAIILLAAEGFSSPNKPIGIGSILILSVIAFAAIAFIYVIIINALKSMINQSTNYDQQLIAQLEDKQNCLVSLFTQTNIGIAFVHLDGRLIQVNEVLCELLGYTKEDCLMLNLFSLVSQDEVPNLQIHIQQLLDQQLRTYQFEQRITRKNGALIWVILTLSVVRDSEEKPSHFSLQVQNITLQKMAEERFRHMAYHDPLTGLANRNKLEQFLNSQIALAKRHPQQFALLFLDLDRFKNINDTIGHEAGDTLLQIIADRLRNSVRSTDMVVRLSGDEFVLLVTNIKKAEAIAIIAEKILNVMLKMIIIKGKEIYITTSIGISFYPYDGSDTATLIKNADLALYRAKEQGRNNYQFYTLEMTSMAHEKLALQNALAEAMTKNEFELYYQPKMEIATRQITGVEALIRWNNKAYSKISPEEIVNIAEETGLIIPINEWVLQTACRQLKNWQEMGFKHLRMAINLSSRVFKQATLIDAIQMVCQSNRLSLNLLELEVMEKVLIDDPESALHILSDLKEAGVTITLDDFGSGYWSLNYLNPNVINSIKISKMFIRNSHIPEKAVLISSVIAMINRLGINSIAMGVETREQYQFLIKESCHYLQGFYLTPPLPVDLMTEFLKHPIPDAESIDKNIKHISGH